MKIEKNNHHFVILNTSVRQQLVGLVVGSRISANMQDLEIAPDKKIVVFEREVALFQIFLESWIVCCGKGLAEVQITTTASTSGRREEEEQVFHSTEKKQKMKICFLRLQFKMQPKVCILSPSS